jgi:hypothetical protein
MIEKCPAEKTKKQISLKKLILTFFVCASVVSWIGISTLFADEDDPADNMENTEPSFQNAAQEQHAKNVAIKAALQDPKVIEAIENAKKSGDFEEARALFKETVADNTQQISDMRAEGRGWGEIAKELDVHPKYLGLGHYKHKSKYAAQYQTKHHIKSENKAAKTRSYNGHNKDRGLALGYDKDKIGDHGIGNGGGNGGGHGRGKK